MGLFIKKPLEALQAEANQTGSKSLKRVLGPWSLVRTRCGSHYRSRAFLHNRNSRRRIYRTGHYTFIRHCRNRMLLCRTLLCRVCFDDSGCGSAYTYSYATMGELIAWIIGWDLVLEYTVAATTVSISWSRYLVVFLEGIGINLPTAFTACPGMEGLSISRHS